MSGAAVLDRRPAVDAAAAVIMLGLTFTWGLNQVAIKFASLSFSPAFMMLARSAIGALCIGGWCALRGIPLLRADGTLWAGIAVGVTFWIEFALIYAGLDLTSAARGGLMLNTMPFWVLVGAHFWLGERMRVRHVAGLAMAFVGIVLVFSDRHSVTGPQALLGDAMCLAGGVAWALNTLIVKRTKLALIGAEKLVLYQLVASTLLMLPLMPFTGPPLRVVSALGIATLLFQAVFVVGITYLVWFWLMRRYPAAGLASFVFLAPVFAVFCGAVLLDEPLTVRVFAALALIAAGLAVVNRPSRARTF